MASLVFYRKYVIDKVGLRDEHFIKYTTAGGADLDYQYRVNKAGFKIVVAMQSYVHHWGSITTRKMGLKKDGLYSASDWPAALRYLKEKHGFNPNKPLPSCFGMG